MTRFCNIAFFAAIALITTGFGSCQQRHLDGEGIVINEVCGKDNDGLEWIEIGNASDKSINLKGYKLWKMDTEGIDKKLYNFPDTTLAPHTLFTINAEDLRARIPYKKAVIVELYNANEDLIDSFDSSEDLDAESHPLGGSYARIPNLTGEWAVTNHATWEEANK
jgi:hypothetical protein